MLFNDPKEILVALRPLQVEIATSDFPHNLKNLRTHKLKRNREAWHAALFAYCYSKVLNLTGMGVCPEEKEDADFDATLCWECKGKKSTARLQLKELVSPELNSSLTLDSIVADIQRKYPRSPDLIVAIYLNRVGRLSEVTIPKLNISQLWLFGWSKPNQEELVICGDMLSNARKFHVPFPQFI